MAEAAVSLLRQTLKDLDVLPNLKREATNELEALSYGLQNLQNTLEGASHGSEFRVWENQIREVIYEGEELIDDCATQELEGGIRYKLNIQRNDLAAKLKEFVDKKFKTNYEEFVKFLSSYSSPSTLTLSDDSTRKRRHANTSTNKTRVVGFEDVIETLINNVMESPPVDTPRVEVISITGMAGLGKTTVAWKIFSDPRIEHEFPTRIWIVVSQQYNKRNIYLQILNKLTHEDLSSSMGETQLASKSEQYLRQVKFLLVLDDVWTKEAWDDIKIALPMDKGTGKVLMTCREDDDVPIYAKTHNPPHRLRFLRPEESWELLQYQVYGNVTEWPQDSTSIGRSICEKFGALPLAIVVIGGILKEKKYPPELRRDEWLKVLDRTEECFMGEGKEQESVVNIIELSYNAMSHSLRDCFLYFGMYPNDMEICAWKLIRLWIAEGFIKKKEDQSFEEIAEENLKELIRRNLVMVSKRNRRGEMRTCRIHDVIREFCKKIANDENLFHLISKPGQQEDSRPPEHDDRRRICIHSHALEFLEHKQKQNPKQKQKQKQKAPKTRSFLCFETDVDDKKALSLKLIAGEFEKVRILEVSGIKFQKYNVTPKPTEFRHLRYMSLTAGENFQSLPESISFLWSLQTIVIDTCHHNTFEIKADVGDLRRLRHVKTKAGIVFTSRKKSQPNDNLQTLTALSADSCKDGEILSKTPKLQTLGVRGDLNCLVEDTCLKNLNYLKKMKMINVSEKPLDGFLKVGNFPPNLEILSLTATNLEWSDMRTLGDLPKLEVLKLKDNAFKGDEWKVSIGKLRRLKYLHIDRSNLSIWIVEEGSLPELTTLYLNNCERLHAVPLNLAKTLQTLEMGLVPMSAILSAENIFKESKRRQCGELKLSIVPGT